MLTLQQILESDSISSLVATVNLNFQQIAISGGGPRGLPGDQGIPGLPGRQGPLGPTGLRGPTGSVVGIIPFASQTGGSTGPTGIAGPWNSDSYGYLNSIVGTGPSQVGNIWIDHHNDGFWQYLNAPNGISTYTNSPYSNPAAGPTPPDGTGYFSGDGWYFYPLNNGGGANAGDVWINDITTYQEAPPFGTGPFSSTSPLTVKNARLLSKYGTVWITSGNGIDENGATDENNLETSTLYDWGFNTPLGSSQPSRYNSGIDRLYFKQSIDTVPYLSNVAARSYTGAVIGPPGADPANPQNAVIAHGTTALIGNSFWPKPLYSPSLDSFSPLQYFTERRIGVEYDPGTMYGSLGLYSYTSLTPGVLSDFSDYRKSLWVYSTRTSVNPDDSTGNDLTATDTFNFGEILFDVKKLTASNQFVCSLPQDLYLSADSVSGTGYTEAQSPVGYTVTQGYISAINGKNLTGSDLGKLDTFNYGNPQGGLGNITRSSWYGSAAMFKPSDWEDFDSGDSGNTVDTHIADRMYRFAGMRERAKKSYNGANTYFLNELTFYSSQFSLTGSNVDADSAGINLKENKQQSLPGFYLSPFRNFGIGTFTSDDSGVFEPVARLHAHAFVRGTQFDGGSIKTPVTQRNLSGGSFRSQYTPLPWGEYPANLYKGVAVTTEDTTSTYLDIFLGHTNPTQNESANALNYTANPNTRAANILDMSIRRETWSSTTNVGNAAIMRFGVSPVIHDPNGADYTIGQDAPSAGYDFQIAISPLNPTNGFPSNSDRSPVGVGIHNLYPRARFHLYGKNLQNELVAGSEPNNPGQAAAAGFTAASTGYYPWANYSFGQVIIDKLQSSWTYNAGYKDYPYEAYGIAGLTATNGQPATGTSGSPNAANFPMWEKSHPTRNVMPWAPQTRNYSAFSPTGSAGGNSQVYMHGEKFQNLFTPTSYIGFNLFRDLLNVGDDHNETRWTLGTQGDNGGSAIVTSGAGDMAFVNIATGRDGGLNYRTWEQRGLSTRDVLNNVSLILSNKGDMGLGSQPGYDYNTFSSQERTLNGFVNYVPTTAQGDARNFGTTVNGGVMGSGPTSNKPYGLINYIGLSAAYSETFTTSNAAKINNNVTSGDYIRFELGAEKFYGKNSRSSLAAGYGYPPNATISITGTAVRNYFILDPQYGAAGFNLFTIATDEEGRIWQVTIGNQDGSTFSNPTAFLQGTILPHPTEFNADSGLAWSQVGFTAPSGACAGILNNWYSWTPVITSSTWVLNNTNFQNDIIGVANMRFNNFIAGEGMSPVTGQKSQSWVAQQVKEARQKSPKLILSFLEADNTTIPGSKATNTTETIGTNRPISGTTAYRKVNTVIASAQNESSLREYWIPKSDNTGGTFMVWTDHYGQKEKDNGFDNTTVVTSNFYLEEVVALEFVPSYTGVTAGNEYISGTATNLVGLTNKDYPLHVKYYNSQMGSPKFGITGATANAFTPAQYGRKVNPFGQPVVNTFSYEDTSAGSFSLGNPNWRQKLETFVELTGSNTGTVITAPAITTTGKPVQIIVVSTAEMNPDRCQVQLRRGNILIGQVLTLDPIDALVPLPFTLEFIDSPPVGSHTYSMVMINRESSGIVRFGRLAVPPELASQVLISVVELDSAPIILTGEGSVVSATGTMSGTGGTGLALLRNVDKYYNLVQNGTNWDDGWNSNDEIQNETSQFRFKRINSEFALIDFNMTISVRNPDVQTNSTNPSTVSTNLIDAGSPRWTQYLRLAYLPSKSTGSTDRDFFMKRFGNSLSFMNWSSFNQWYAGSAITSDPINTTVGDALSNTGGPNYTMGSYYDPAHPQTIGWNGNFYDATMSSSINHASGNYTRGEILGNPSVTNDTYSRSGISPFYGNSFVNGNISKMLIWDDPQNLAGGKSYTFGSYMGKSFSILGNDYLSKVRNCSWRVVPRIGNEYGDGVGLTEPATIKNNSFALEVMFDKPILHIDTPFAKTNFSSTVDVNPCYPYQYLTVSGQAMVRYSDSTNTVFNGPTVVLNEL